MAVELFMEPASIKAEAIQYKGALPIIPDLVSGRLSMAVLASGNVTAMIDSGQLKGLATFGEKRGPNTPAIPTMVEQGYQPVNHPLQRRRPFGRQQKAISSKQQPS